MGKLYERLTKFRDESYAKINNSKGEEREQCLEDFKRVKDVIKQLMELAFFNESEPGVLPNTFEIRNAHYTTIEDFVALMKEIGYDVEAVMTSHSLISGIASFKVTMTQ